MIQYYREIQPHLKEWPRNFINNVVCTTMKAAIVEHAPNAVNGEVGEASLEPPHR